MRSQARIQVNHKSLFVHFEKVGRKSHFERILNRWLVVFPQAQWSNMYRAWELPVANFEEVKSFCDKMFGTVIVEPVKPPTKRVNQLELNL